MSLSPPPPSTHTLPSLPLRSGTQEVPLIKMSYEDRIRGLEEALNARERSIAQLTNRLGQIEAEYHKVCKQLQI